MRGLTEENALWSARGLKARHVYQGRPMRRNASIVRKLQAALLVPLVLSGAVTHAALLYRCRMDGVVRRSCCCPAQEAGVDAAAQTVSGPSCCAMEQAAPGQAPSTTASRAPAAP